MSPSLAKCLQTLKTLPLYLCGVYFHSLAHVCPRVLRIYLTLLAYQANNNDVIYRVGHWDILQNVRMLMVKIPEDYITKDS